MRRKESGRSVVATWASSVAPWIEMRHSNRPSATTESMNPGCGNMTPLVKITMCSKPSSTALPERVEEALVHGRLAAEERQMIGAGGAGVFERLEDRLERHRPGDLHRGQLTAGAEDAAVVAEVAELDLELVPGARGRDRGRRATIFFADVRACGHSGGGS